MIEIKPMFLGFFLLLFGLGLVSPVQAASGPALENLPGSWQASGGGVRIYLENSLQVLWPAAGNITLQQTGSPPLTVDLKATPQSTDGAEALGLDVEETDLGGGGKSGRYLQNKKQPKGRRLDPSAVGKVPEATDQGKSTQSTVLGIPITRTDYANGATRLEFNWGRTTEEVFLDRRETLVSVELRRKEGGLEYRLKQWGDGSFSRLYSRPQGEVEWTYDALGHTYRLRVANGEGQTLREWACHPRCQAAN